MDVRLLLPAPLCVSVCAAAAAAAAYSAGSEGERAAGGVCLLLWCVEWCMPGGRKREIRRA